MSIAVATAGLVLADRIGWHHDDVGSDWWIAMMLGMVIFWGLIIFGAVWLLRGQAQSKPSAESPLEILQRRLAQGEISIEEYDRFRTALRGT